MMLRPTNRVEMTAVVSIQQVTVLERPSPRFAWLDL